jgi:hypothetical protein
MRDRKRVNHSHRRPPKVRARNAPGLARLPMSLTAAGRSPRTPGPREHGGSCSSSSVPARAGPNGWANAGRALVTAGGFAGAIGGVLLVAGSVVAYLLLGAGMLLAVAGALVRHPRAAEHTMAALMILLLAPLLLAIALAVRLTSAGPVLVRRAGGTGRGTSSLRFRTTFAGEQSPDARYTLIGRLLHRTYLDELPGLLDGLRREMPLLRAGRH